MTQPAEEEKVMPALLWVAFWSSLMATAACFGEMSRAVSIDKRDRTDAPRGNHFHRIPAFRKRYSCGRAPSAWLPWC